MFEQSEIVNLVKDVLPLMQQSENAEKTLLKFAADKNLPESVLERMCHTFNALKTNSYMSKAASQEERGVAFSTINTPDLIKEYKTFKPKAESTDSFKTAAVNVLNKLASSSSSFKKQASSKLSNTVHNLSELTYTKLTPNASSKKYDKLFEEAFTMKKTASDMKASEEKPLSFGEELEALHENQVNLEYLINEYNTKFASIIDDFIEEHPTIGTMKDKLTELGQAIADKYSELISDEAKEEYINKINSILSQISQKNKGAYNYLKDTAENLINKTGLNKKEANIKSRLIDTESKGYKMLSECLAIKEQVKVAKELHTEYENLRKSMLKKADEGIGGFFDFAGGGDDMDAGEVITILNPVANKEITSKILGKNKSISEGLKSDSNLAGAAVHGLEDYLNMLNVPGSLSDPIEKLMSIDEKSKKNLKKQIAINSALTDMRKRENLQKLLQSDPVISSLSKEELDDALSAYSALSSVYPKLAENPAFLKGMLRSAAQLPGGVDANSMTLLAKLYTEQLKAKELEAKLKEKENLGQI